MIIVIQIDEDGIIDYLRENTLAVTADLNWVSGPLSDVIDGVVKNMKVIIDEDPDD